METKDVFFGIDDYMAMYAPYIKREEARELAQCYVVGLMMEGERKSVEPMSEKVHASERGMQRLLTEVKWDRDGAFGEYRRRMLAETADPQGVLAVDDTGFPKKGRHSVCVARQYSGSLGKVDNCQVGVSLTYVGQEFAWPYAMELFVPESWDDPDNPECVKMRKKTYMPEDVHYREKWLMALDMIDQARTDGASHRAVVADGWYGNIPGFRQGLDDRQEHYVVGVYSNTQVFLESPVFVPPDAHDKSRGGKKKPHVLMETHPLSVKVSELGKYVMQEDWEHLEIRRDCLDNPLVIEAVSRRVFPVQGYRKGVVHEEVWLIIERRKKDNGEYELRYFFSNMPQDMPTLEMVRLFHERFWIEQSYQQLKEELGLDHHEGRSWPGWRRHVLLVIIAFGYLTLQRIQEKTQTARAVASEDGNSASQSFPMNPSFLFYYAFKLTNRRQKMI
jgi:SRSO17 transposase